MKNGVILVESRMEMHGSKAHRGSPLPLQKFLRGHIGLEFEYIDLGF